MVRHIVPISGKDSAATAVLMRELQPNLDYEYIFNETGSELPEVYAWLEKMESYLGRPITRIGANLENIIYEQGVLPSIKMRYCTRLSKLFPMEDWIGPTSAVVYYGIRADESRIGYQPNNHHDITPCYPLADHGLGLQAVWSMLEKVDLLPPSFRWERVYQAVIARLGFDVHFLRNFSEIEQRQLFAWRSRMNCHHCFYQRLYEFVGLLDHHPDLFWHDAQIEEEVGGAGYFWRENNSLRSVAARADQIRMKRIKNIVKTVYARAKHTLFVMDDETPDMLEITSCGLLCGK